MSHMSSLTAKLTVKPIKFSCNELIRTVESRLRWTQNKEKYKKSWPFCFSWKHSNKALSHLYLVPYLHEISAIFNDVGVSGKTITVDFEVSIEDCRFGHVRRGSVVTAVTVAQRWITHVKSPTRWGKSILQLDSVSTSEAGSQYRCGRVGRGTQTLSTPQTPLRT